MYENCDNTETRNRTKYSYDAAGRRQNMLVSGQSAVTYSWDSDSRLSSITQGAANVAFGYDVDGRRNSMTLPNGVTAAYGYDSASQLTSILYQGGALAPSDLEYTYDLAGRRVGGSGSLANTQLPSPVSSAAYNANNQLTQWGSTAMTYDLNGNTLNDGTNTYVWDARNRLVSANSNGATFAYDPFGRRTDKNILTANTNFLYDGINPVQELNGATVTANLLTGLGIDERFTRTDSTGTSNFLTDALGSTIGLTSSSGNSTAQYSYSPFGAISITGTTSNSYTYTGREIDGLGINYYRARYYNPSIGRFISEDPLGFRGSGPNLYAYAGDDPMNFNDPFGLERNQNRNFDPDDPSYQLAVALGNNGAYTINDPRFVAGFYGASLTGAGAVVAAPAAVGAVSSAGQWVANATGLLGPTAARVFWSAIGSSAAAEWAEENGGSTLEMSPLGGVANWAQGFLPKNSATGAVWNWLSQGFASGAQGPVTYLQGAWQGNTWLNTELPILLNNGNPITWIHR